MAKDVLHVVPHNEGWGVKREGNERFSSTHSTQKEAIDSARNFAHDGDDIVIHRPDGTIRERVTHAEASGNAGGTRVTDGEARVVDAEARALPRPRDLVSVGSRVSWQAVLAGLAVTFTTYVCLMLLAVAVGASTVDHVQNRTFAAGAAAVGIATLVASLLLGGFVTSRLSTGETASEAVVYGVLLWASLFFVLLLTGMNLGSSFGLMPRLVQQPGAVAGPAAVTSPGPGSEALAQGERMVADMDPVALAWWSFGGMVLSVLAAIAGSVLGAGPELVIRQFVRDEPARRVAVEPTT